MNANHSGSTKSPETRISPRAPPQTFRGASPVNCTPPPLPWVYDRSAGHFPSRGSFIAETTLRLPHRSRMRAMKGRKKPKGFAALRLIFVLMISREKYVRAAMKTEFSPAFEGQPSVSGISCKNNILIFIQQGLTAIPSRHVLPEVIYIFSIYLQFITYNCNPFPARRLAPK